MYFTDRGIEELTDRRGDEQVSLAWLAERLRDFVDLNPGFDVAVDRLASWLARLDDDEDLTQGSLDLTNRVTAPASLGRAFPQALSPAGRSRYILTLEK
jgi:hypothetical protein